MATKNIDLAVAFLQKQPAAAAQLLERQPPAEVASVLAVVPHTHATRVLAKMLPEHTARICKCLADDTCAALLGPLGIAVASSVLRRLEPAHQARLIVRLPEKLQLTLRVVLNYAADSIGAWMIPNGPVLPRNCAVGEALERITIHGPDGATDLIPIVDRDGLLRGTTSLPALLAASSEVSVAALMSSAEHRLRGRATLETEAKNLGWQSLDTLPVVNRADQLVGVLRHADLRQGLAQHSRPAHHNSDDGLLGEFIRAYSACFVALANTLVGSKER